MPYDTRGAYPRGIIQTRQLWHAQLRPRCRTTSGASYLARSGMHVSINSRNRTFFQSCVPGCWEIARNKQPWTHNTSTRCASHVTVNSVTSIFHVRRFHSYNAHASPGQTTCTVRHVVTATSVCHQRPPLHNRRVYGGLYFRSVGSVRLGDLRGAHGMLCSHIRVACVCVCAQP